MKPPLARKFCAAIAFTAIALVYQSCCGADAAAATGPSVSSLTAGLKTMMNDDHLDPEGPLDPFAASSAWAAPVAVAPIVAPKPVTEDFRKTHILSALMQSSHGGMAIVNGRMLKVGDVVDGYKLLSISATSATLTNQTAPVQLQMVGTSDNTELMPNK